MPGQVQGVCRHDVGGRWRAFVEPVQEAAAGEHKVAVCPLARP